MRCYVIRGKKRWNGYFGNSFASLRVLKLLINTMLYQSGKGFNHLVEKEEISILVKNFIITAS